MTIAADATEAMIQQFGEEVTVHPQASDVPEDDTNPIYFQQTSSTEASFTEKVRLYTAVSEDDLKEYGFDAEGDAIIYNTNDSIERGDEIEYGTRRYVVGSMQTNQHGDGDYVWVYKLVEV